MSFSEYLVQFQDTETIIFTILLGISLLIMLYAITLIGGKVRLIESEIMSIKKDQSLMTDELEIVASAKSPVHKING